jgi:hypothetical protein
MDDGGKAEICAARGTSGRRRRMPRRLGRCEPERAEGRRRTRRSTAVVRYSLFPIPYSLFPIPCRYRLAPDGRDVGRICTSFRAEGVAARPPIAVSR